MTPSPAEWLEERLAHGHESFGSLLAMADQDPAGAWDQVADRGRWPDPAVAAALSAGIVAGVHRRRFPRLAGMLAGGINDQVPPGAVRLPALRRLLWAVAIAVPNVERIEPELGAES
jgi:hypothetical protein